MPDAIALFRPKIKQMLEPFLDLDPDAEESDGLYAEELDDGAFLVHTFQPFELFAANPAEARVWLAQFGVALPEVHDDPRGLLFFPDEPPPEATTYDGVIAEAASRGLWVAPLLAGEDAPLAAEAITSFEVAQLFTGMQEQLLDALGIDPALLRGEGAGETPGAIVDEEFAPDAPPSGADRRGKK